MIVTTVKTFFFFTVTLVTWRGTWTVVLLRRSPCLCVSSLVVVRVVWMRSVFNVVSKTASKIEPLLTFFVLNVSLCISVKGSSGCFELLDTFLHILN